MSISLFIIILLAVMALVDFAHAVIGPTAVDRILASSAITTKGLAIILLLSYSSNNAGYIDVAIVLALCGFVGILALLRSLLPEDADILTADLEHRPKQLVHFVVRRGEK